MRTLKQQVEDALWYLKKPGQTRADESKAIEILSTIASGKKGGKELVEKIQNSKPTLDTATVPWGALRGVEIAVVIGHEPGGGASGERAWNKKCGAMMKCTLEKHGAKVLLYEHKIRSYGARQDAMRAAVKTALPSCFMVWELHYDGYKPRPAASGHHFKYRGAKDLARLTQEEFSNQYPQSRARFSGGLHHCTSGNGAGFLKKSPGWAILTEPFFITNPAEKEFFKNRWGEVSEIYCMTAARFAKLKGK